MGIKVVTRHGKEVLFPAATRVEDIDAVTLVLKDAQGEVLGGVSDWDHFMKYDEPKDPRPHEAPVKAWDGDYASSPCRCASYERHLARGGIC